MNLGHTVQVQKYTNKTSSRLKSNTYVPWHCRSCLAFLYSLYQTAKVLPVLSVPTRQLHHASHNSQPSVMYCSVLGFNGTASTPGCHGTGNWMALQWLPYRDHDNRFVALTVSQGLYKWWERDLLWTTHHYGETAASMAQSSLSLATAAWKPCVILWRTGCQNWDEELILFQF